jgi:hypothetical protein
MLIRGKLLKRGTLCLHQTGCFKLTKCLITCNFHGVEDQAGPAAINFNGPTHKEQANGDRGVIRF